MTSTCYIYIYIYMYIQKKKHAKDFPKNTPHQSICQETAE